MKRVDKINYYLDIAQTVAAIFPFIFFGVYISAASVMP